MPAPENLPPDPAREERRCRYCGIAGYAESYGGPEVCPTCDTGAFDPSRLAQTVDRLRAQLAQARQRVAELEGAVRPLASVSLEALDLTADGRMTTLWVLDRDDVERARRALAGPDAGKGVGQ